MKTHYLKTWPEMFNMSIWNCKSFEYRKNDRDYQSGDILYLQEYDPKTQKYSGRVLARSVTWILHGGQFGIPEGYCIMSVVPM